MYLGVLCLCVLHHGTARVPCVLAVLLYNSGALVVAQEPEDDHVMIRSIVSARGQAQGPLASYFVVFVCAWQGTAFSFGRNAAGQRSRPDRTRGRACASIRGRAGWRRGLCGQRHGEGRSSVGKRARRRDGDPGLAMQSASCRWKLVYDVLAGEHSSS